MRSAQGLVLLLLAWLLPVTATAQMAPSLDLQRFDPAANRHGFVLVEGAQQLPALKPGFDLYFGYAHHLLQRSTDDLERRAGVVDGLISGHLRVGFGFTDWAEIDVKMPFLQVARLGEAWPGEPAPNSWELSLGDVHIEGRFRLLAEEKAIGVALIPFLKLPTGRRAIYTTAGVPTFGLKAALSKRFRPAHFAVHVGYEMKPNAALAENFASDDEIHFGVGVGVSPVPDWLDINLEVVGAAIVGPGLAAVGESPHKAAIHVPVEVLGDVRLRSPIGLDVVLGGGPGVTPAVGTPEWRIFGGVGWAPPLDSGEEPIDTDGDGITDDIDPCPDEAEDLDGHEDGDGCPDLDNDFDRVPDTVDDCPNDPEDRDGFEDGDGCPDLDNDEDGIVDEDDLCPNRPEVINGERDDDGCPDDVKAVVTKEKIVILDKILFVTGRDEIVADSFPILEAVKDVLLETPRIKRVRIEGHTDHRGDDDYNQELSEKRAKAVLRYLIKAGVEGERLDSMGFGESMPIADNATESGMQKNRRVEFVIVEQD